MKRKIIATLLTASVMCMSVLYTKAAEAEKNTYGEPFKIRCTCYTAEEGSITASGSEVMEGIIAGKKEWLGCVAILYDMDMNFIGFFEFKDTGAGIDTDGDGKGDSIKNGTSVDVFRDSLEGCHEWIEKYGDHVFIQIIEGKG